MMRWEREHTVWPNMKWWRQNVVFAAAAAAATAAVVVVFILSYIFIAISAYLPKNFWIALFEKVMCVIMQLE